MLASIATPSAGASMRLARVNSVTISGFNCARSLK